MDDQKAYQLVQAMSVSKVVDMVGAGEARGKANRRAAMQPEMERLAAKVTALREQKSGAEIIGIRLFVYGFSRGAAQARTFTSWLQELTKGEGDSYLFAGVPISIEFLGIFETVASVGVAYLAPFVTGHMSWASGTMRLPDSEQFLKQCVHIIGAHEQRGCFPLDSIRRKADPESPDVPSTYRAGTYEYIYPGVHSDVGGGYPAGDQGKAREGGHHVLSQIALHHMYSAAFKAGAPMQVPGEVLNPEQLSESPWLAMGPETIESFRVASELITRFNAWQKQLISGTVEEVMNSEAEKLTAWRIERYARGSMAHQPFYQHVSGKNNRDMRPEEVEAFEYLHGLELKKDSAARGGESGEIRYASEEERTAAEARAERKKADCEKIKADYEARTQSSGAIRLNTHKTYEPYMDGRQLREGALEFRRDYLKQWGKEDAPLSGEGKNWPVPDETEKEGFQTSTLLNALLGGLIYLTNEQDEAEEYQRLREQGRQYYRSLFNAERQPVNAQAALLIALYDDQVHDSRAWFMHSALNQREVFTDYFRYRAVFFDNESSKRLSLLARGGQVVGVGIALASVGLAITRKDPRYLVGLALPSLATPVLSGQASLPAMRAFDIRTGITVPMLSGLEAVRAFTQDTGSALNLAAALPAPVELNEATANTPALQHILQAAQAAQAAEAANQAKESGNMDSLLEPAAALLDQQGKSPLGGNARLLNQLRETTTSLH
ncbi:T6SS phospholipase effector Tle1-like catalytic domain-containing protein [Halopseudomonas sp.]|uniref:T6SS phospholipase effector Tle1-like catalytic domain-containing protein n=1 Tax=Halopseudomonas sp. TaxID=2901191 RepID=UPI003FA5FDD2